jgi:hypothetical protein
MAQTRVWRLRRYQHLQKAQGTVLEVVMGLSGIVLGGRFVMLNPDRLHRKHHQPAQAKEQRGQQNHPYQPNRYRLQGSEPAASRNHCSFTVPHDCTNVEDF